MAGSSGDEDGKPTWPLTTVVPLSGTGLPDWLRIVAAVVQRGREVEVVVAVDVGHADAALVEFEAASALGAVISYGAPARVVQASRVKVRFVRPK